MNPSDDNEAEFSGSIDAERVLRFVVKDCGKGIDKEDYPKIFQPFIQTGEEADSENIYGGTGLGT